METKRGGTNEHIVHNLIHEKNGTYYYSITRADGYNLQERAKRKAEKYNNWSENADRKSDLYYSASLEGRDFLSMGEPIKVCHHSENRHRALIERNNDRMGKSVEWQEKSEEHQKKAEYWKGKTEDINLSIPESVEYYKMKKEQAEKYHSDLKTGVLERPHSYSLTYAKKEANEMKKNYELAVKLWGDKNDNL